MYCLNGQINEFLSPFHAFTRRVGRLEEVLLFSGGPDSFYLLLTLKPRRIVHFIVSPEVAKDAVALAGRALPEAEISLYDHRPYLRKMSAELKKYGMERYLCLACKKAMVLRASEEGTPVLGDSLGQVASQVLENATFISEDVKVLRPLFGSDKEDLKLDHPLRALSERVGARACPFKPAQVATKPPRGSLRRALIYLIRKNLSLSRKLGMWKASNLTALG